MKRLKLSDYFRIVKPTYTYLRIKPNNSVRNTNSHNLAKAIAGLYKDFNTLIHKEEEKAVCFFGRSFFIGTKFSFDVQSKVAYYIYLEKKKVEFYFVVPAYALSILKEKISDVWGEVTVEEVEAVPLFTEKATTYQLTYKNEDALSLATDRSDNNLLKSTLNVIDVMEEGDKAAVLYNFCPLSPFGWASEYRATLRKVKQRIPVDRDKFGLNYVLKRVLGFTTVLADDVTSILTGKDDEKKEKEHRLLETIADRMAGGLGVSKDTAKKATATILNTQIVVMSESANEQRQRNNARSLSHAFDAVAGEDNMLLVKPYRKPVRLDTFRLPGAAMNKMGDLECQNFLALPGRQLLDKYGAIEKIETQETEVPEDLRNGVMCIGTSTYRGHEQKAYLSEDPEFKFLSTVIIGPNRAGKSTLIQNLLNDALNNGECALVFDYIKKCELSEEIAALFPPDKVLRIDCRDFSQIQGLGYNEIRPSKDPFIQWENAKRQSTLLHALLNSINGMETQLTSRMERYLTSACLVVSLCNGPLRDVFRVLQDHRTRREYMQKVPAAQKERMEEYVGYLEEINEYSKEKIKEGRQSIEREVLSGTKDHLISGIIDRLTKLKVNTFMELMLKQDTTNNIDLVAEFQKNQIICLQMPETMFPTDPEKDLYATYWLTKVWCALQVRGDIYPDRSTHTKVNMVIDELYQVRNCEKFLATILSRLPKFGIKPIISCHYVNQIHQLREELRSASPSYMLIAGSDKKNYAEFKEELQPFTLEDLLTMKKHHSLNLVKTTESYARFITALPPKLKTVGHVAQKREKVPAESPA